MEPQITFWAGVGTVTGANFLFEFAGKKMLVDCGLLQGERMAEAENRKPFPYSPASIDILFVTHAHLDHVGKIPKLVKDGFKGVIYSTPETKALARLIMEDSMHILGREASSEGVLPLYELKDIEAAALLWKEIPYHTETTIIPTSGAYGLSMSVFLRDAGHILGSTMYQFTCTGVENVGKDGQPDGTKRAPMKVVFTGDLGNSPAPLLEDTECLTDTNYLVMESTYGDRNHEPKQERIQKLARIINEMIARKGTLVIPAFSLERTQVILYELDLLLQSKQIPVVPVFVDSPLATKITEIYSRSTKFFNADVQKHIAAGDHIFNFPDLRYTGNSQESRNIDRTPGPKIIIASSGMSTGGRVGGHEAEYLPDPKNTILLVGYQSLGTLGRKLQDGIAKVQIGGVDVDCRAHIETIFGYSSHKDSDHLVAFVESTAPTLKRVFVVMGEPKASLFLVQKIRDNLGVDALLPERGIVYKLEK